MNILILAAAVASSIVIDTRIVGGELEIRLSNHSSSPFYCWVELENGFSDETVIRGHKSTPWVDIDAVSEIKCYNPDTGREEVYEF